MPPTPPHLILFLVSFDRAVRLSGREEHPHPKPQVLVIPASLQDYGVFKAIFNRPLIFVNYTAKVP